MTEEEILRILKEVAAVSQSTQQQNSDLSAAEIQAARNRGIARALAIFQAEYEAEKETLARLRLAQLGGTNECQQNTDKNLAQIASLEADLLNNYREFGQALGKAAAAQLRLEFTEKIKEGLSHLKDA